MKNISNLRRSLIKLKEEIIREEILISSVLKEIDEMDKKPYCPNCLARDLRVMKNNKIFCRTCGYSNRSKK